VREHATMGGDSIRILALEPYHGGSHAAILEGLVRWSRHEFEVLRMPARKWKWRMRGAAVEFADRAGELAGTFDLVFASDMISGADWRALAPAPVARLPLVVYFHENQLTYPVRDEAERDYQYGFTNITTCLAADEVWFNSDFHRREFLAAVEGLLKRMSDFVPARVPERIAAGAKVMHPGVESPPPAPSAKRSKPHVVLWNHRWEWDKNPDEFFAALRDVRAAGTHFRLAVAGESFRDTPAVFAAAREEFAEAIVHWGHLESRAEYMSLLSRCDIVVSTARHEFFGVAVLEAAAAGCVPLLPRRLSYPEIFPEGSGPAVFYDEGAPADSLHALLSSDDIPGRSAARALARDYLWENRIGEWDAAFAAAAAAGRAKHTP